MWFRGPQALDDNLVEVWKADTMTEKVEASAIAYFYARHAKNLTLTAAANALNLWPSAVSQIELGRRRDDALAQAYREWLAAA